MRVIRLARLGAPRSTVNQVDHSQVGQPAERQPNTSTAGRKPDTFTVTSMRFSFGYSLTR